MRISIVSILLAGGMLALGACASVEPRIMTLAERTDQCQRLRTEPVPTGRQTGDARHDYDCGSTHAGGFLDRLDRNVTGASSARSAATDRALRGD
jgi:hypothetical protein